MINPSIIKKIRNHDPTVNNKFNVLSIHWNRTGLSNFGKEKSSVSCNGKKLKHFTAVKTSVGFRSFALGAINPKGSDGFQGEVGRLLVCINREHPMNDEDILIVHKYLMWEWNIQVKGITPKR